MEEVKTPRQLTEEAILEHLKAIYKLSTEYGTRCYTSCAIIDYGHEDGVYFNCNNSYFSHDGDHPLNFMHYEHMEGENTADSENAIIYNKEYSYEQDTDK